MLNHVHARLLIRPITHSRSLHVIKKTRTSSVINGRVVVEDGRLLTADLPVVLGQHRKLARSLFERAAGQ